MNSRITVFTLAFALGASLLVVGSAASARLTTQESSQEKSRPRRSSDPASEPSPTPTPRETLPVESDEVVRVETSLTNIFFTAADKNKRFVGNLKQEDVRILEDGRQQEIFTFQQNIDLPLSTAILIDTSRSEERTLPDEKVAARQRVLDIFHPDRWPDRIHMLTMPSVQWRFERKLLATREEG